jgi:Flp pilus assembly protein TadG
MRHGEPRMGAWACKFLRDRRGATAITVGLSMFLIVGMLGFVVDVGHAMYAQRQLQASADAAALAGARKINCCTPTTAVATAKLYSAAWSSSNSVGSNKNASSQLYVQMASGYPQLKCFTSTNVSCTGPDTANGIVVKQTANVPMWFASIFGVNSVPISATATASGSGGSGASFDVEIIIDTTASMSSNDSACGMTKIKCALSGLRLILNRLSPNADYIGVMAFPPLSSASQRSKDTTCPSGNPTTTAYKNWSSWSSTPTYQIVPMSHDYQTSTVGQLNTSSGLVVTAGGSTCQGLQSPGGYGTYYADAINAAQYDLANNGRSGVSKAIIILSDGDAGASSSNMTSSKYANQCTQAVNAAATAKAAGTKLITVAYGAPTSGCSTDTGSSRISPCNALKNMASDPSYFYSDNGAGCTSTTNSLTNVIQIMGSIASNILGQPRLIPNNTT